MSAIPPSYLLVAIDGTLSGSDAYTGGYDANGLRTKNESHVVKFHANLRIPDQDKFFSHGPERHGGATGWDSSDIYKNAWEWLRVRLRRNPTARLILVGHSRGGHIVAHMANVLSGYRQGAFVEVMRAPGPLSAEERARAAARPVQPVYFMGLYDAVDMTTSLGNTETVPANVEWCYHAMRSERIGSRRAWGNTATKFTKCDQRYQQEYFDGTHGAMGGAVPEACDGNLQADTRRNTVLFGVLGYVATTQVDSSCLASLTLEENFAAGEKAHAFVVGGARKAGLPI